MANNARCADCGWIGDSGAAALAAGPSQHYACPRGCRGGNIHVEAEYCGKCEGELDPAFHWRSGEHDVCPRATDRVEVG
jgi:hypothetical protein